MAHPASLAHDSATHQLFREANDAFIVFRPHDQRVVDVNPTAERMTHFERNELCAFRLEELFLSKEKQGLQNLIQAIPRADFFHSREGYYLRRKNQPPLAVNVTVNRLPGSPEPFGLAVARDVHDRHRLVDSLQLLQFSVDESSMATFWIGRDAKILHVNQAACRMLEYTHDELLQRRVHDIDPNYPAAKWTRYWRELKARGSRTFVSNHRRSDGRFVPVEVTVKYLEYAGQEVQFAYVQDISERTRAEAERRRLEELVIQAQKLESLGVMAGGIAHDFNNLLTVILGNALLIQGQLDEGGTIAPRLHDVIVASKGAAELCQQMLAYTGKCNVSPVTAALDDVLRRLEALPRGAGGPVRHHYFLVEPAPVIQADIGQLIQVLTHLRTNALEALGPEGGDITFTTGAVQADRALLDQAWLGACLPEGPCAFVEISDTGCGMDAATRSKMFEPFFSTKFIGRGLGLAFVFGIMRAHRGAIMVRSQPGQGTSVRLLFPVATPVETSELASPLAPSVASSTKGTILVVEDEAAIRELVRRVLEERGYHCILTAEGMEALRVYKTHHHAIDLVLLDLTMPRMGGEATFHQLRAINPTARVILCTGYDAQQAVNRLLVQDVAGILQKPYTPSQLLDLLESALCRAR